MVKTKPDEDTLRAWALAAQTGDSAALERLIRQFRGIAVRIVKRLGVRHREQMDDLAQDGIVGLTHAAVTYDPSRGAKVFTYMYLCCRSAVQAGFRRWRKGSLGSHADSEAIDSIGREPEPLPKLELADVSIGSILNALGPDERALIACMLGKDGGKPCSLRAAADYLGWPHKRAMVVFKEAKKQLRAAFPIGVAA